MNNRFIKLHISILLAGFTGLFGKLISLNEGLLVWYRMLFAAVVFYCILLIGHKLEKIAWREKLKICGVGLLLALHWVSFFGSINWPISLSESSVSLPPASLRLYGNH